MSREVTHLTINHRKPWCYCKCQIILGIITNNYTPFRKARDCCSNMEICVVFKTDQTGPSCIYFPFTWQVDQLNSSFGKTFWHMAISYPTQPIGAASRIAAVQMLNKVLNCINWCKWNTWVRSIHSSIHDNVFCSYQFSVTHDHVLCTLLPAGPAHDSQCLYSTIPRHCFESDVCACVSTQLTLSDTTNVVDVVLSF